MSSRVARFLVWTRLFVADEEPPVEPYEEPRPLTEREREVLAFMLTADLPGIEELREQAQTAVAARWGPRDPSFSLYVNQEGTRPSPLRTRPAIFSWSKRQGENELYSLMLWVDGDGWLSAVELTPFHEEWPEELLPPSEFETPGAHEPGSREP